MFENLFRKTEPKHWFFEQPTTKVLLLPSKFLNNDVTNQVFTGEERRKLIKIFEEADMRYVSYDFEDMDGDESQVMFQGNFIRFGEFFLKNW